MKKKEGKYLKFYYECMEIGTITGDGGLCNVFGDDDLFDLFYHPDHDGFWGYDGFNFWSYQLPNFNGNCTTIQKEFTPLRQNIVLFMACMNGEL